MLIGLEVTDDARYQTYRERMSPILAEHGGGFGYDFKIAEVLRSRTDAAINRVFMIHFAERNAMTRFFGNTDYKRIKAEFFEPAVASTTVMAEYET